MPEVEAMMRKEQHGKGYGSRQDALRKAQMRLSQERQYSLRLPAKSDAFPLSFLWVLPASPFPVSIF